MSLARRPVRILHTSDVHLGPAATEPTGRRHQEHCVCPIDVIEHLVAEHVVDVVLIVGDLFDHARLPDSFVTDTYARLGRIHAEVAVLPGNHDVHDHTALATRNRTAIDASGITFFDHAHGMTHDLAGGALRVWARAMQDHSPTNQPLAGAPTHPGDRWYVIGAHGHFASTPDDRHRSSPITSADLDGTEADYVALGHWHVTTDLARRGVQRPAWYSGAPLFGHGAGRVLLVDLDESADTPVRITPIDVLDHPSATC